MNLNWVFDLFAIMTSSLRYGHLAENWEHRFMIQQFLGPSTTGALLRYDSINRSYVRTSKIAYISIFRMHFAFGIIYVINLD